LRRANPVRGFVDQGQGIDTRPHNIWIPADAQAADLLATYASWAAREGSAVYVIPGTVTEQGLARAEHVLQMQALVVDLDTGDIPAKLAHLVHHLGAPTLLIESGGMPASCASLRPRPAGCSRRPHPRRSRRRPRWTPRHSR